MLVIVAVWNGWRTRELSKRLNLALGGTNTDSLESTLAAYFKQVKAVDQKLDKLNVAYEKLALASSIASQKISVVRFNPFGDTGGDQSFTLAVLDAHNSGYVITSIHGREGTRVYIKPVDYGKSKYALSAEEKQALQQAISRVPNELKKLNYLEE